MFELLTFGVIQLLGAMSPGPDNLLVIKNSIIGSRKTGIFTAIGIAAALFIHVICVFLSFVIINRYKYILLIIKFLGSIYLIYLGLKAIFIKSKINNTKIKIYKSFFAAFKEGFLCNLLNPKVILFLIGILSVSLNNHYSGFIRLLLIGEIIIIPFFWFTILSVIINIQIINNYISLFQNIIIRVMGFILIGFAIKFLFIKSAMFY